MSITLKEDLAQIALTLNEIFQIVPFKRNHGQQSSCQGRRDAVGAAVALCQFKSRAEVLFGSVKPVFRDVA